MLYKVGDGRDYSFNYNHLTTKLTEDKKYPGAIGGFETTGRRPVVKKSYESWPRVYVTKDCERLTADNFLEAMARTFPTKQRKDIKYLSAAASDEKEGNGMWVGNYGPYLPAVE